MCRIITPTQLHRASDKELCALFNRVMQQLYCCKPGSAEHRVAFSNLENVRREIVHRAARPRPPTL